MANVNTNASIFYYDNSGNFRNLQSEDEVVVFDSRTSSNEASFDPNILDIDLRKPVRFDPYENAFATVGNLEASIDGTPVPIKPSNCADTKNEAQVFLTSDPIYECRVSKQGNLKFKFDCKQLDVITFSNIFKKIKGTSKHYASLKEIKVKFTNFNETETEQPKILSPEIGIIRKYS